MRTYSTREEIFYLLIRTYVSIVLYFNVWKHTDFSIINRYVDNNFHVSPTVNNATEWKTDHSNETVAKLMENEAW